MTIEERLERLESFMGDIDRIKSLYANSVQEICDKYLNLLYIETPEDHNKNILIVDGFLAEIDLELLPRNVVFNVRASHNFDYQGDVTASKIRFKRDNKYVELPLKKYDVENPGNLVFLEPNDYISGIIYDIYINSQGIAVISSSDTGAVALQEVAQLNASVQTLIEKFNNLSNSITTTNITATTGSIGSLSISDGLSLVKGVALPTGSTCAKPTEDNQVANLASVRETVRAEVQSFYDSHHVFGTGDPNEALKNAPNKSIFYRYN